MSSSSSSSSYNEDGPLPSPPGFSNQDSTSTSSENSPPQILAPAHTPPTLAPPISNPNPGFGSQFMKRTESNSSQTGLPANTSGGAGAGAGLPRQWPHLYQYISQLLSAASSASAVAAPASDAAAAAAAAGASKTSPAAAGASPQLLQGGSGSPWGGGLSCSGQLQQQQQHSSQSHTSQSSQSSQPNQHPLSVSSSGSGSGSDDDDDEQHVVNEATRAPGPPFSDAGESTSSSTFSTGNNRSPNSTSGSSSSAALTRTLSASSSSFSIGGGGGGGGAGSTITAASSANMVNPGRNVSQSEKEAMLKKVVDLLENEREEECKKLMEDSLGVMGQDAVLVDQICLDLMHKHNDDLEQVPYAPTLTPIRSARASPSLSHAQPIHRPFTPTRIPSFRTRTPLGRSQSPVPSSNAGVIGQASPNITPTHSAAGTPTYGTIGTGLGSAASNFLGGFTLGGGGGSGSTGQSAFFGGGSPMNHTQPLPSVAAVTGGLSPASSPRFNHAKPNLLGPLPSPYAVGTSDPWGAIGQLASPVGTPSGVPRSSSNLAVAAPLTASSWDNAPISISSPAFEQSVDPWGAAGAGVGAGAGAGSIDRTTRRVLGNDRYLDGGVDDIFSHKNKHIVHRSTSYLPEEEEDDEFSPFSTGPGNANGNARNSSATTSPQTQLKVSAKSFDPTRLGSSALGHPSSSYDFVPGGPGTGSGSGPGAGSYFDGNANGDDLPSGMTTPGGSPFGPQHGEGMTPLDVLQSVFTTLPPGELEDALMQSGYEFEGAMAILIAKNGGTRSDGSTLSVPPRTGSPAMQTAMHNSSPFGRVPSGRGPPGYFQAGGRSGFPQGGMGSGHISPRFTAGTRSPGGNLPGGLRICRYYLAGECRRADCRFSHDVDRALCRFWLKGQCAKGEQCEFIHAFPSVDPNALSHAMSRIELSQDGTSRPGTPPSGQPQHGDEFPDLQNPGSRHRPGFDPSRNRFANAVKRPTQGPPPGGPIGGNRFAPIGLPGRRFGPGVGPGGPLARTTSGLPAPRPSPRIKLRPPTLLPTLPTGGSANEMYMEARANAIRLGQARNACLARAADAWRRGDGASAKRFSREANVMNEKMTAEGAEAAAKLVRQRRVLAQEAIRARGDWSDDPGDRAAKGKECGGGLGVVMGIASPRAIGHGGEMLSAEERTECLADLHTLHAEEGVDVLEDFLLALEKERFVGLAYIIVGEERHTASQDPGRGASKYRLSTAIKQFLARFNYPWSEGGGCICIDPATHN